MVPLRWTWIHIPKVFFNVRRLVSAYLDKIRDQNDASYFWRIAIIRKKFGGDEATFENFVRYILDSPELTGCVASTTSESSSSSSLSSCDAVDAHWRPFFARCAYCDVDYDVIGKLETFEEDVR